MNKEQAMESASRVTFSEDQRKRSQNAYESILKAIEIFYENAPESPELTIAIRKLQEATHWHSCAIASESK